MKAQNIVKRFRQLQSQRKGLDAKLTDINHLVVPSRGEFDTNMLTEHEVNYDKPEIADSTAIDAANQLASMIHSNLMSPVTQWFRLTFRDEELNSDDAATEWLQDTTSRYWQELQDSNFITATGEMLLDTVSFGTSIVMQEQKNDVLWEGIDYTAMPLMDTYFEMGPDDKSFRVYRRIRYTRLEFERRFPDAPEEALATIDEVDLSSVDAKIEVLFCVYERNENPLFDDNGKPLMIPPEDRPFGYKYVVLNNKVEIEEGGYYIFPARVVRWSKVAGSKWGKSPAHDQMANIKQLNDLVIQTAEARAIALEPPILVTERGIIGDLNLGPRGVTVCTEPDEVRTLYPDSNFIPADQERQDLRQQIEDAFFKTILELKVSPQMTATEVMARLERIAQVFSSVVGRIQTDYMRPTIESGIMTMLIQGQLMELPESISEVDLDIQYIGPIPRAQQSELANGIRMWLLTLAEHQETFPQMMDVPDVDACARKLGDLSGVPATLMLNEEEVEAIREQRAVAEKQALETEQLRSAGEAAEQAGKGAMAAQEAGVEA